MQHEKIKPKISTFVAKKINENLKYGYPVLKSESREKLLNQNKQDNEKEKI